MRISDWSSDVCSSDLSQGANQRPKLDLGFRRRTELPMSDVITKVEGQVGRIRLNRPKAIHALTKDMCTAMIAALVEWRGDGGIPAVMLDHAEGRGFCAGRHVRILPEPGAGTGKAPCRDRGG